MNTTELIAQVRADIAARKTMPDFGPETSIERIKTINATQRSFTPETVEALVEALESAQRKIAELEARPVTVTLPAHKYRECVNGLLEEAIAYAGTQQLRERLTSRLANFVQPDHPHTRCSVGIKCEVKGE